MPARRAIDVHAAQQWLVEAGLEFVRDEQDLIIRPLERLADVAAVETGIEFLGLLRQRVRARFQVADLARKRDQRADLVAALADVFRDRELPPHGLLAAREHHHRTARNPG